MDRPRYPDLYDGFVDEFGLAHDPALWPEEAVEAWRTRYAEWQGDATPEAIQWELEFGQPPDDVIGDD
ncbi:hypothetical protein ITJ64_13295 [Herbiconiux sp. VKM Ac-1786]|uniref:hypothetical protein n=1 Tax=Herbiconiux sp. VKM Ac-1786 TaxID=2783824 RepID=UPI00188D38C3|nr:hypothetical protein [Herbiconiux sp. VKM Ac-1786]MBF4573496.1 hypothetical protein [Herbiconiux sp. VKM Ac-1786]